MLAAIDIIHNFITQYSSELGHCCDAIYDNNRELQLRHRSSCDTLVLGSLIKGAQLAKSWLKPEKPHDFNFDSPAIGIRKVEIFSVCSQRDGCPDTVERQSRIRCKPLRMLYVGWISTISYPRREKEIASRRDRLMDESFVGGIET